MVSSEGRLSEKLLQQAPFLSADLNPIEEAFSKFKHVLAIHGRALDDIELAVSNALEAITPANCHGYYSFYL